MNNASAIAIDKSVLLGTWLRGEHLEDLKHITAADLPDHAALIKDLKAGMTLLDLVKKYPKRAAELAAVSTVSHDVLYRQSLAMLLEQQVKNQITELSLAEVYKKLDYAKMIIADCPDAEKDLSLSFLKELRERSVSSTIKYSGLPTLTSWTGGLKGKALTTIAARPGVGKSALGLQIAYGAVLQAKRVLYFPLEMTAIETAERLLAAKGYATTEDLRSGHISDERSLALGLEEIDAITEDLFKIYEGQGRIEIIEALIRKEHPDLVVIDQLSQMRSSTQKFNSIREQYAYMTRNLKRIAMAENVSIILLAQLNRGADTEEPGLNNLKESGSIEEDSDNVILLHRLPSDAVDGDSRFNWISSYPMTINLAKQRAGRTGKIKAIFWADKLTLGELV